MGAGDALLAGTVFHYCKGLPLVSSVQAAVPFAAGIIMHGNCNASDERAVEFALSRLDKLASRDALTGLYNRQHGQTVLEKAWHDHLNGEREFSVLLLDIDHFKQVNDRFGHNEGDAVLQQVAISLDHAVRAGDVVCRWGGEEFLCLLTGANEEIAQMVAERIRYDIELMQIPIVGGVTVSVGVAGSRQHITAEHFTDLIKQADMALYKAKSSGRNLVVIASEVEEFLASTGLVSSLCSHL